MKLHTRAKVNLHLDVLKRRPDGYHEIETILQSVGLHDEIEIEFNESGTTSIEVECDSAVRAVCDPGEIPTDQRNLCARAMEAMRPHVGRHLGARIRLLKRIPWGAGLGGGSANAAGVILAVNKAHYLGLSREALEAAALEVGSDVPFMLHGGTMLGRGRGEILSALNPVTDGDFLIVKPELSISTAWVYANFNSHLTMHRRRLNLRAANSVLARIPAASPPFRNALEDVVCPSHPVIASALDELLGQAPCIASMSGSGSALFAVFAEHGQAARLAERFSVRGFFSSVVEPAKRAVDIM